MKQIQYYEDLGGGVQIGWERDDVPLVHVFTRELDGKPFEVPMNHWPCEVCNKHNFTSDMFFNQWANLKPIGKST